MSPLLTVRRLAGLGYLVASAGFLAVFGWLAAHFGYPGVLDHPAGEVLPALLALGATGRGVWMLYAALPLLLIPAAVGAAASLGDRGEPSNIPLRLGVILQLVAAVTMTMGLARWSTAQWALAEAWPGADASQRVALAAVFDALNRYLGNAIGEFLGELMLYGSFLAFGLALRRSGARWMGMFAGVTGLFGLVGMFRNITATVQPAADVTNFLLPGFLIAFGVLLLRRPARG